MREKEERNNEGRERGERMRDNIFDESRLIFEARKIFYFNFFQEGLRFFLKSATLHLVGLHFLKKRNPSYLRKGCAFPKSATLLVEGLRF